MTDESLNEPVVASPRANADLPYAVLRGLAGMLIGGAVGTGLFYMALRSGYYAIVLPGAAVGMFCGGFAGRRYVPLGIVCGLFAAALTLGLEWWFMPFRADDSLTFFLLNFWHAKKPFNLVLMALGPLMAYWFGLGRDGAAWFGSERSDQHV